MGKQSSLNGSRLYCPIQTYKDELFFSLVDYRNSRFTSNNPDKIIDFYDSFKNRDDLIEWMKERPRGAANIYEVEGDKEIIVVIPTADFNGKYAKECRENIFKGLHMIFVESGGREDFYFNYAHNCNTGIRKAMAYNPKWVVLSNDDMIKKDDVMVLEAELRSNDPKKFKALFAQPSKQHSSPAFIGRKRLFITDLALLLYYGVRYRSYYRYRLEGRRKWFFFSKETPISRIITKDIKKFFMTMDFIILSGKWCASEIEKHQNLLDETYINSHEDTDLSLRLSVNTADYMFIQYRIDGVGGGSFDPSHDREIMKRRNLTAIANKIYFDRRVDEILGFK